MGEGRSPLQGTVVRVLAAGDAVGAGTAVVVIESMKMEHAVEAGVEGTVAGVLVNEGDAVVAGQVVATIEPGTVEMAADAEVAAAAGLRADLAEVIARHAVGHDAAR